MQNHDLRGQKNPHVNKPGQGRKNVGNGLAKLVLFPSGTKLAQSSTGHLIVFIGLKTQMPAWESVPSRDMAVYKDTHSSTIYYREKLATSYRKGE